MRNQAGFSSVEFLISLTISGIFCVIMFSLCFTFTVVEVSQYIAYSVGRAHMAGHLDPAAQKAMADNKFKVLINDPVFSPLFKNGWFDLGKLEVKSGGESGETFGGDYPERNSTTQTGVRLTFTAKLLSQNFVLLGSTSRDGTDFTAKVTGLLIREPTTSECQKQLSEDSRYKALINLDANRFNSLPKNADAYMMMEDNGC
jgi:hypothetical protein